MKKRNRDLKVEIATKVVYLTSVKVKAYTRVRNGRIKKVRSHLRRLGKAKVETIASVSK